MLSFGGPHSKRRTTTLQSSRNPLHSKGLQTALRDVSCSQNTVAADFAPRKKTTLQQKMAKKLRSGRFRQLNETLYKETSEAMFRTFQEDPTLFDEYHEGYRQQVSQWKQNPTLLIVEWIRKEVATSHIIADLGCGEAYLAKSFPERRILSYDLVSRDPNYVTAANIAALPLQRHSVHVVVFCLSLMGSDWPNFLGEATRILMPRGILKVAEVQSRFSDLKQFVSCVEAMGYQCTKQEDIETYFSMLQFKKVIDASKPLSLPPASLLHPCLYKKR